MGQRNFKKHFKFHNFSEIFYCGMTRLRNTNLSVFIQGRYLRTILTNKNVGQSLFKKHSKFRWNILLWHDQTQEHEFGCFYTMSVHKNYFKKEIWDRVCLRNIQSFWYSIRFFTVTWPNAGTNNRKFLENIFIRKLL